MALIFAENSSSTPYSIRRRWTTLKCKCGSKKFAQIESKMKDRTIQRCESCGEFYQVIK